MPDPLDADRAPEPGAAAASRRALLVNAAASWLGFAAQVVATFFLSPVLIHGLGDRRYGIWALVDSVLAYLMLFDLGRKDRAWCASVEAGVTSDERGKSGSTTSDDRLLAGRGYRGGYRRSAEP